MGRDLAVENLAGSDLHDNEDVEGPECSGDHHEEIASHHYLGVVVDEGQPALFRVRRAHRSVFAKVLTDCGSRKFWDIISGDVCRCRDFPISGFAWGIRL